MWLLNAKTKSLEYFNSERDVPGGYAILSHTWDKEEVSFQEVETAEATKKLGYVKIEKTCLQALRDGLPYAWVDTCCIDKKSSTELSEAINSMFKWYQNASLCYVYLSDVVFTRRGNDITRYDVARQLQGTRWLTRGWTLQELIAPRFVKFYDRQWHHFCSKLELAGELAKITKVDERVLMDAANIPRMSIAKRMSWAAHRRTSREEDQAYSLLGIFDVNMPLLYGEGPKSFTRLQEEIVRQSSAQDHSILVWIPWVGGSRGHPKPLRDNDMRRRYPTIFSSSPFGFRKSGDVISWTFPQSAAFQLTPDGLLLSALQLSGERARLKDGDNSSLEVALNCRREHLPSTHIVLEVIARNQHDSTSDTKHNLGLCDRVYHTLIRSVPTTQHDRPFRNTLVLARSPSTSRIFSNKVRITIASRRFKILSFCPPNGWDPQTSNLSLTTDQARTKPGAGMVRGQLLLTSGPVAPRAHSHRRPDFPARIFEASDPERLVCTSSFLYYLVVALRFHPESQCQEPIIHLDVTWNDNSDIRKERAGLSLRSGQRELLEISSFCILAIEVYQVTMAEETLWNLRVSYPCDTITASAKNSLTLSI